MGYVKPKKHLGQHFLTDDTVAQRIVASLSGNGYSSVLEIGPGTGVLTRHLLKTNFQLEVVEVDRESVAFLSENYPELIPHITQGDFLKLEFKPEGEPFAVIGNFPYNISSQILFKVHDNRQLVPEVVGMFQKEVAERITSPPGSKRYGVISVLLQAYYHTEYLFTVDETQFNPPPKVKSGVLRMVRLPESRIRCDHGRFRQVVKQAFNQRRKTLRNSLRSMISNASAPLPEIFQRRPETLSVEEFSDLTDWLKASGE